MKKRAVASAIMFLALAAAVVFLYDESRVQRAAIGGEITWVVEDGAHVEEGDALVRVAALSGGEAAAARANVRGVVRKAFVAVGGRVRKGDAVAKIGKE